MSPAIGDDFLKPNLSESAYTVDDIGTILADGQSVHHDFTIRNTTDRAIRLLKGEALTPCCSAIEKLPKSIPAGSTTQVPVVLKAGRQTGAKTLVFVLNTDDPRQPTRTLALRATLVSAWEVEPVGGPTGTLRPGQSAEQRLEVVARGKGDLGCGLPEEVVPSAPLAATYLGKASETTGPDGLIEFSREVLVKIPGDREPGERRGSLLFRWRDGKSGTYPIRWEVRALVSVTPGALVLRSRSEPFRRTFVISSIDKAFRITGVSSPLLARAVAPPAESATQHRLTVSIDASRAAAGRPGQVTFHTDHPDQPEVSASVLVISASEGQVHAQR
ncbi:MAG: hypothetical protein ACP5XB_08890 [Isosphaeraceae bacterium]